jgi:transcriptional regulator with XRE-family HTH domain
MNIYSEALRQYLERADITQQKLADQAGCSQAAICRYADGARFPDRPTADRLDDISKGEIPITLWRIVAAERAGLAN